MAVKPRIAVVSPFLDKKHGTERCVLEQVERLAREQDYEIHIYSQRVEDVRDRVRLRSHDQRLKRILKRRQSHNLASSALHCGSTPSKVRLVVFRQPRSALERSKIPRTSLRPGLFARHQLSRCRRDHRAHRFSRILSASDRRLATAASSLTSLAACHSPALVLSACHGARKEDLSGSGVALAAVSWLTAHEIERYFARCDVRVIPNAVDLDSFNPDACLKRRAEARRRLQFDEQDFVLLLIGNDWKKKGVDTLLTATSLCLDLPCKVLIVGHDDRVLYNKTICDLGLQARVRFVEPVQRCDSILCGGRHLRRAFASRLVCVASCRGHGVWIASNHHRSITVAQK